MDAHEEMHALLNRIYTSFETGDASPYLDSMSEDAVAIGTDDTEWWVGRTRMAPVLEAQLKEMSQAGIRLVAGETIVGASGDAVWAALRPTIHLPDGSSQQLRGSVVATREGGRLLIRHLHFSAGAPNEEVVQMSLTTE